jgi:hypothetical protein
MNQIVEQLIKLNSRDWLDIVGIVLPIILTVVIIFQNRIYSRRTDELEKQIHNRDQVNRYQSFILTIYNTYYDFCDTIFTSGFDNNIKNGNVNLANAWVNNLIIMRLEIVRNMDLAKLIFGRRNKELYHIVEERFKLSIKIIDKYVGYINSGKLYTVSENAWEMVIKSYPIVASYRYDYAMLVQNMEAYDNFIKLCKSEELEEIQNLIKDYQEKHSYDSFDKYFEEYFSLDEL